MASAQTGFFNAAVTDSGISELVTAPMKGGLDLVIPILLLVTMGWKFMELFVVGKGKAEGRAYRVEKLLLELGGGTVVGRAYLVLEEVLDIEGLWEGEYCIGEWVFTLCSGDMEELELKEWSYLVADVDCFVAIGVLADSVPAFWTMKGSDEEIETMKL